MKDHKDATGAPIVVGRRYGYSTSNNGIQSIVFGRVTKADPSQGSVRFQPEAIDKYAYGRPSRSTPTERTPVLTPRSITSMMLFPQPSVEENDLGGGLTLQFFWNELDSVIGKLNEAEDPSMQNIDSCKFLIRRANDELCAVFDKIQGIFNEQRYLENRLVYEKYKTDPQSVDAAWQHFFDHATPEELKPFLEEA